MPPEKRITGFKQAWVSVAALALVVVMFFAVIVPFLRRSDGDRLPEFAPDFSLEVIHGGDPGNRVRLSDLRGKAVVLDFWASWCKPCAEQMPIVDKVAARFQGKDVVVVGVNTSDSRNEALQFLRARSSSYPSVFDEDGAVMRAYGISTLPVVIVVDKTGRVRAFRKRVVSESELEGLVASALSS
jgi:cytochrome c biogenesis protein CcmG, thiol:disulfide interchange protein DsbE